MTWSHFPGSWPFLRRTPAAAFLGKSQKLGKISTPIDQTINDVNFLWPIAGVSTGHLSRQNTHRARPSRVLRALSGLNASIRNAGWPDENPVMHPSAEGAARQAFTPRSPRSGGARRTTGPKRPGGIHHYHDDDCRCASKRKGHNHGPQQRRPPRSGGHETDAISDEALSPLPWPRAPSVYGPVRVIRKFLDGDGIRGPRRFSSRSGSFWDIRSRAATAVSWSSPRHREQVSTYHFSRQSSE